jgi:hypothetical protein
MSKQKKPTPIRCEGWRRTGIFQMGGTGRWEQCRADAVAMLKFKDTQDGGGGKVKKLPACKECWAEVLGNGITILEVNALMTPNPPSKLHPPRRHTQRLRRLAPARVHDVRLHPTHKPGNQHVPRVRRKSVRVGR